MEDIWEWTSVSERLSAWPASCLTHSCRCHRGEVQQRVLPVGGEECVSTHRVHRLPVTLPYASEVRPLITTACDSRTTKGAANETGGKRRIRGGGWGRWSPSPHVRVRHGEDDHLVVIFRIIMFVSEGVWCVLRPCTGPRSGHLFNYLFNSSDKTNWILVM